MTLPTTPPRGWTAALVAVGTLAVLAVLPPLVGGPVGSALHTAFSAVCHQLPDRSPHLGGDPIALCHRCSGILLGLLLGVALAPVAGRRALAVVRAQTQPGWLGLAVLPAAVDWGLGALGVWANTPASRLSTGAVFGVTAGVILAANLLAPPRRTPSGPPPILDAQQA